MMGTTSGTGTETRSEPAGGSRRSFLKGVGAVTAGGVVATMHGTVLQQSASASSAEAPNVLVVLSLRGGADGLSIVVPYRDLAYVAARPKIAIPPSSLLCTDSSYGLHPQMAPLQPMWKQGQIGAVNAVGQPSSNLSHVSATDQLEEANPGASDGVGWLNRLIAMLDPGGLFGVTQIGQPVPHTEIRGPEATLAAADVENIQIWGAPNAMPQRIAALDVTWDQASGILGEAARIALDTAAAWGPVLQTSADPQNGAEYPPTDLGDALAQTARVIRSNVGVGVIAVDHVGWDMHVGLGTLDYGDMVDMVGELASAVNALYVDLAGQGNRVTLVTMSEFGRRIAENGDAGVDHGYGNLMLVIGAGVQGGYVHSQWPGCGHPAGGNLKVTTDYRSVLAEVVKTQFPTVDLPTLFPGFTPTPVGVMQGS